MLIYSSSFFLIPTFIALELEDYNTFGYILPMVFLSILNYSINSKKIKTIDSVYAKYITISYTLNAFYNYYMCYYNYLSLYAGIFGVITSGIALTNVYKSNKQHFFVHLFGITALSIYTIAKTVDKQICYVYKSSTILPT